MQFSIYSSFKLFNLNTKKNNNIKNLKLMPYLTLEIIVLFLKSISLFYREFNTNNKIFKLIIIILLIELRFKNLEFEISLFILFIYINYKAFIPVK